jgi:8-oxo-dGTP pyrophosphatase MutT (NUDIX family)
VSDPAQARVVAVDEIDARRLDGDWPWAREQRDAIERHWETLTSANPALFNGRVLVRRRQALEARRLTLRYVETDYASFIAFRDFGFPDPTTGNGFAMAALRSSDGAYLLGRMAAHTANPGKVYFPAGTPDPDDVLADGTVDLAGSVLRELEEETGLAPADVEFGDGWTVTFSGARTAMMKEARLPDRAEAARARILGFLAREPRPELADIRIVRGPADIDAEAMPPFMQAFLHWAFSEEARARPIAAYR